MPLVLSRTLFSLFCLCYHIICWRMYFSITLPMYISIINCCHLQCSHVVNGDDAYFGCFCFWRLLLCPHRVRKQQTHTKFTYVNLCIMFIFVILFNRFSMRASVELIRSAIEKQWKKKQQRNYMQIPSYVLFTFRHIELTFLMFFSTRWCCVDRCRF